jgi:hypothetical protein
MKTYTKFARLSSKVYNISQPKFAILIGVLIPFSLLILKGNLTCKLSNGVHLRNRFAIVQSNSLQDLISYIWYKQEVLNLIIDLKHHPFYLVIFAERLADIMRQD